MEKIKYTIHTKSDYIRIIPFGDLHYPATNCRIDLFQNLVNYIKETPDCYAIGMGDLLDAIVITDRRFDPSEKDTNLDTQIVKIRNILEPIKNKIICLLTGNHEYTIYSRGYGNPIQRLCRELGIKYAGYSAFIKLHVEPKTHKKDLVIYAHHGWAAGRQTGATVNNIENLSKHYEADVFLLGHSHKLSATSQVKIGWGGPKKNLFVNTGSFLETSTIGSTSYSERRGYPPLKLGVAKIRWRPFKNDLHVSE